MKIAVLGQTANPKLKIAVCGIRHAGREHQASGNTVALEINMKSFVREKEY